MKRFMKIASIVLGMVLVASMTSCEKDEFWLKSDAVVPEDIEIKYWGTDEDGDFLCDESLTHKYHVDLDPSLKAERTYVLEGNDPLEAHDTLAKRVTSPWEVVFRYNYDVNNTVKAEVILTVVVNNKEITVRPIDTLWIKGVHEVKSVNTAPFGEVSQTRYTLVNQKGLEICATTQEFQVKGTVDLELISRDFSYEHLAWEQAVVNGANVVLKCNNMATLVGVYSDGRSLTLGNQLYKVTNNYQVQGLQNVMFPVSVKHNTYDFNNGTVTVAGNVISLVHQGDEVVGDVIIDGINYKDAIDPCHATPYQISFNNGYATITFVDEEGERVIVNFDVDYQSEDDEEEEVTLIGVTKSFEHIAFRQNAIVSGNQISLICDNIATFVSNYSNGTASSPAHVDYTVTNRYNVAIGTLSTENIGDSSPFTHNGNGVYTATIGGVNVTLNYQGTTVANIIYNGVNYKNNAPQCLATPTQVALISASQARITFKHVKVDGTVEVITATIAVTTQTPTTALDLPGQVVKAYISDSYVSNVSTTPEEWLHVLVNHNGSYKIYSAPWQNGLGISSFASVDVSAHFTVLSNLADNEAIAKVYHHDGGSPEIGIVQGQQYSTGGWKITYLDFNRDIENMLEFSISTISNYNGRNPKRLEKIGAGIINYNGITVNIQ